MQHYVLLLDSGKKKKKQTKNKKKKKKKKKKTLVQFSYDRIRLLKCSIMFTFRMVFLTAYLRLSTKPFNRTMPCDVRNLVDIYMYK